MIRIFQTKFHVFVMKWTTGEELDFTISVFSSPQELSDFFCMSSFVKYAVDICLNSNFLIKMMKTGTHS